ncbi:TetR/AcrR family transcriptional regulator [bacterium]|nr:TetR/AcrR family transcriptional regulator [bacterium]
MIPTDNDTTKGLLIRAASRLFAQKGLDGTTIKDIVDEAGVNVSLVSYHFNGKDGLFQACVRSMGQQNLEMAKRLLEPADSIAEFKLKLEIFISELLTVHAENPDVTRIIHREIENGSPFMDEVFQATFAEIFQTVIQFFIDAQHKRLIRSDLDCFILSSIITGSIVQFGRMDNVGKRHFNRSIQDPTYRKAISSHLIESFINGAIAPRKDSHETD